MARYRRSKNSKGAEEDIVKLVAIFVALLFISPALRNAFASLVSFVITLLIFGGLVWLVYFLIKQYLSLDKAPSTLKPVRKSVSVELPFTFADLHPAPATVGDDAQFYVSSSDAEPSVDVTDSFLGQRQAKSDIISHIYKPGSQQIRQWDINVLNVIEWKRFEIVCAEFFRMRGFVARETAIGADGGVDIRLYYPGSDIPTVLVQCKAWHVVRRVGVELVRALYGVVAAEGAEEGYFVTSADYTSDAIKFAEVVGKKLTLFTGERLLGEIMKLPEEQQNRLLDIALAGDYKTPTCPQCDVKMVLRETQKGQNIGKKFWGCSRFPKCKHRLMYREKYL